MRKLAATAKHASWIAVALAPTLSTAAASFDDDDDIWSV